MIDAPARMTQRMDARLVPSGTRRVWRITVTDGSTVSRVCESESLLEAIAQAFVPTPSPS